MRSGPTSPLHRTSLTTNVDKVSEQILFSAKSDLMEKQDPEFAALLREYKEGILLYQAEQEQVWNRVAATDTALHAYFDDNRDRFTYPDRVAFTEMRAATEQTAAALSAMIKAGKSFGEIVAEDSVRMAQPFMFDISFARGKSALSKTATATLASVGAALTREPELRLLVSAFADTTIKKKSHVPSRTCNGWNS